MKDLLKLRRSKLISCLHESVIKKGFKRPIVAFSGGPDSCLLLSGISILSERKSTPLDFSFFAFHVNHNLRDSAKRDEDFCVDFCKTINVPVGVARLNFSSVANIYHRARQARYDALFDFAKANKCDCILTAHHGDDFVETVILQSLRGVERSKMGLPVVRPMFDFTKIEIENILKNHEIPFMVDPSNFSDRARSKIRREILPVLKSVNPSVHLTMRRIFSVD
jgi:tRNA(Ile)-lysidine synthase